MSHMRVQKAMVQPINLTFKYLKEQKRVEIWLYEQPDIRFRGVIIGLDEHMNLVLDDVEEISVKKGTSERLSTILLKGDNVTLTRPLDV